MKKRLIGVTFLVLWLMLTTVSFTGCGNMQVVDTTWKFDRAIITLPNGESIEGKVDSWTDFESSDMIQVKVEGKTYLTHSSNVILISE